MNPKIWLSSPHMGGKEQEFIKEAFDTNWIAPLGPNVNGFENDIKKAEYCLKDVYVLHRWSKIQQNFKEVNFLQNLEKKKFTDIDTLGAVACAGGACEIY